MTILKFSVPIAYQNSIPDISIKLEDLGFHVSVETKDTKEKIVTIASNEILHPDTIFQLGIVVGREQIIQEMKRVSKAAY